MNKNPGKKTKKMNKPWTLPYTLVLQAISSPLRCFFFLGGGGGGPIYFPTKIMPCEQKKNLIFINIGPSSKSLGDQFKAFDQ
jgi:hypothetical protein